VLLNYGERWGEGPPVIFLHGVGSVWRDWESILKRCDARAHLFALDLRGCGRSSRPPGAYRMAAFARDVIEFMSGRGCEPAVLVGHSLGALVALHVALECPHRIRALVLEDPPLYLAEFFDDWVATPYFSLARELALSGRSETEMAATFHEQLKVNRAEAEKLARSTAQIDPNLLEAFLDRSIFEGLDPKHMDAMLSRISCPALVLHGAFEKGSVLRRRDVDRARSLLAGAKFLPLSDLGHGLHTDAPEVFSKALNEFLDSLQDPCAQT